MQLKKGFITLIGFYFMTSCSNKILNNTKQDNCSCIKISRLVKKCVVSYPDNHIRAEGYCSKLDTTLVFHGISPKTYNDTIIRVEYVRINEWQFFDSLKNSVKAHIYDKKEKFSCFNSSLPNDVH